MAYEYFANRDDEDSNRRRRERGQNQESTGFQVNAPNPDPAGAPGTPQDPSAGVKGDSGSNFVNFEQYFNANSGAAQGMADNVAGQVESGATKALGDVQGALGQYTQDVTAGTPVFNDPNAPVNGVLGAPTGPAPVASLTTTPGAAVAPGQLGGNGKPIILPGPTKTTTPAASALPAPGVAGPRADARAEANARAGAAAQYTGPQGFEQVKNYSDLVKGITKAGSQVNALGSTGGREALAQQLLGSSTQGGSQLDAALMGAAGGARFDDIGKRFGDSKLENYLKGASQDAAGLSAGGAANTKRVRGQYQGEVDQIDAERAAAKKAADEKALAAGTADTSGPASQTQKYSDYRGETSSLVNAPITESLYNKLTLNEMVKLKNFHHDNSAEYQRYAKELAAKYGEKF